MPFVNIRVTKEAKPVSTEQKKELINGVSDLLVRVLGKNKASIVVIIDEIEGVLCLIFDCRHGHRSFPIH